MATIVTLVSMWFRGWVAVVTATIRRLLLGPTLPTWMWRTEWAVASARAVIAAASSRREDPFLVRFGMRVTLPVPLDLLRDVDLRRVHVGTVEADRYLPTNVFQADTTILYFHGGGYTFGNPGTHRQFIARLVHATQAGAVAPRYRLAPRHRFPAAVDDALEAYRGLLDAGIDPTRIVLAGDSAGGGLTMALLLRIRDEDLPMPAGAIVFSPYVDLEHGSYTIVTNARTDYLPLGELSRPNDWYTDPERLRDPQVSPVNGDMTGLPPLLVFAGGAEMLLGDSIRLGEIAQRDGVDVELVVEPEMMHVWPAIADWEPATDRALDTARRWIDTVVASRPTRS
jgi:acetyl esterase/lipase